MKYRRTLLAAALLLGATAAAHASPYVVTIEQVGSNVVATGSGQIDLAGTEIFVLGNGSQNGLQASDFIAVGSGNGGDDGYFTMSSGPSFRGTGNPGFLYPDSSSGECDS